MIAAPLPPAPPAYAHEYAGARANVTSARVCLTSATIRSGFVAVWVGVSNSQTWLQAGVAEDETGVPYLYVEQGADGEQARIAYIDYPRQCATIKLLRSGASDIWRVRLGRYLSWPVWVPQGRTLATGESSLPPDAPNVYAFSITSR